MQYIGWIFAADVSAQQNNIMNPSQKAVLEAIKSNRKATYAQATANGGNGRTLGVLIGNGLVVVNQPKKAGQPVTYSLTPAGTAASKPAKASKKAVLA